MRGKQKRERSPREIAVAILDRIDRTGGYAEPLLDAAISSEPHLGTHDRGLLTELVYGTLRMRGRMDWIVARLYKGNAADLKPPLPNILRTGLYQILFTDRIPPFAAVNEAVVIAKRECPAAAGLVNALLRNAIREKDGMVWPDMARDPGKAISICHSHPRWLVERWLDLYGIDETIAICKANNTVPPLTLRVNRLKASRDEAIASLATDGIAAERTRWSPDGLSLSGSAAGLRETSAFRDGLIRFQDEASQLVARLVAPQPGKRVLDLCSGWGGKTMHLAALMHNRGELTAVDLHPGKLKLLAAEALRLGVTITAIHAGDAAALPRDFRHAFDRVLLDAPCSGLGTLRRNPEIRWRISPSAPEAAASLQKRLLESASACVKPGGRLVYSVCTLTPEENASVVEVLRAKGRDLRLSEERGGDASIPPAPSGEDAPQGGFRHVSPEVPPELVSDDGFFRTFPHRHGMDGFFAAVFTRQD